MLPKSTKIFVEGKFTRPFEFLSARLLSANCRHTLAVEVNEAVRVYDTSGPWSDSDFHADVNQGLPALCSEWILGARRRGEG